MNIESICKFSEKFLQLVKFAEEENKKIDLCKKILSNLLELCNNIFNKLDIIFDENSNEIKLYDDFGSELNQLYNKFKDGIIPYLTRWYNKLSDENKINKMFEGIEYFFTSIISLTNLIEKKIPFAIPTIIDLIEELRNNFNPEQITIWKLYIENEGEVPEEMDWRPNETTPEDYYAL